MIVSNRIVFLNWIGDKCTPCKNQQSLITGIKKQVDSSNVSVFNVDYSDYGKHFKKLGNVALPSLNLFVDQKPIMFVDTKLAPMKKTWIGFRNEKIVEKRVKALVGSRTEGDLIKVFKKALEML